MKQLSLVALTGAFAAGIWLGGLYDWPALMLYGTGMVTLAVAVWCIFRLPEKAWIFILAAFVVAGSIRFLHTEAVSPSDISRYTGQTVSAVAIVDAIPETVPLGEGLRRVKYILDVRQVMDSGGIVRPASGKLIATVRQDERFAIARYGDRVVFTGLVAAIHTYQNPGAYDYVAAQKRKGITARASISSENWAIVEHKPAAFWAEKLADWRTEVKQAMLAAMTPEQSAILTGMLFGGYEGIPQNVVKDFAATGLIHILSVSGTHIALVGGAILWLGRAARLRRSFIVLIAAAAIVLYSMLAGFTPPVVRSAVMGLVALLAVLLGREKDAAAALALSALAMLIHTPGLLYDLSFQLSFAATAGLVFLYPATVQKLTSLTGMHGLAAAGLAVTFAAQLSVLPLLAWYFNSLSLSAFAANVLIVPIVEAIVIIGLAGAILVSFWGLAASALFALCGLSISIVMTATAALAALPGSSIYLPPVSLAGSVLYYLLVAWVYGYTPRFMPPPVQIFRRWPRTAGAVMLIAVAAGVLYCTTPRPVAVHFIDVGQGDAVLVTTPHGRSVLIDTGGAPGDSTFDIGERVVVPYLKHYGVLSLDYLILSHGHQDHAGGAAAVVAAVPAKQVLLAAEAHTPAVRKLLGARGGAVVIPAQAGQQIVLDGVHLEIVHAAAAEERGGKKGSNESSTAVRIAYGQHSFLLTGDMTAAEEAVMLSRGLSAVTVLKVAHHGAKTSTSHALLAALKPQYAVISAGAGNKYGHPHAETIERLKQAGVNLLRTDKQGAIVFTTDGASLSVEPYR